jgi:hypothetical protein
MHNSIISKLNKRQIFFPIIVTHFWVPTQNKKIQKKIFGRNPKNNRSEKRMLECRKMAKTWLRRFKNAKG